MQKRITKNLTLKILAFLIAVFLWLIVVNIDDPVDDKTFSNIPVQVTHEEVITDNNNTYQIVDNTQEVNVTVTAQRSVLDKIKAEDIQATADMKELTLRTQVPIEITIEVMPENMRKRRQIQEICRSRLMRKQKIISRLLRQQQVL